MLKELFFTAVIFFVLFRLFGNSRKNNQSGNVFFTQNNFSKKDKENPNIVIPPKGKNADKNQEGEYIDYEEIK